MEIESYQTVKERAVVEIVIRKSRFISAVAPITTEVDAARFVSEIKAVHKEANHNVWAWVVDERQMRCSDDGEPSGTAGRPVLEVIQRKGLVQIAMVVTRYFGGILLGAGGLVRAYSQAAQEVIAAAGIQLVQLYRVIEIVVDYSISSQIKYYLEQQPVQKLMVDYGEKVVFHVCCLPQELEALTYTLGEMTGGRVELLQREDCYL
ncbi:MAG: YigZ family protein [Methylocystaceae bacterium]